MKNVLLRIKSTSLHQLLLVAIFLICLKQIIFGLSLHTVSSKIFTLSGLLIIFFCQFIYFSKNNLKEYIKANQANSFLLGSNLFISIISILLISWNSGFTKLISLKSLNFLWVALALLPIIIWDQGRKGKFNPGHFFERFSLYICYFGGGLFIVEALLVRLGHFNRLQMGAFLLSIEEVHIRNLWGFLANETQTTGLLVVSSIFLFSKAILNLPGNQKNRYYAWVITLFAVFLGSSITTVFIFLFLSGLSLLLNFKNIKKRYLIIAFIFLCLIILSPPFIRLYDYLTINQHLVSRLFPELSDCNFKEMLIGTHNISKGCRAKDVHLLEHYFQTNLILLISFISIAVLPLFNIKIILREKFLVPLFLLYIGIILLSLHYDLISSWIAAIIFLLSWSVLTQPEIFNKKEQGIKESPISRRVSNKPFKLARLTLVIWILFLVPYDLRHIIDLPLIHTINQEGVHVGNFFSTLSQFTHPRSLPKEKLEIPNALEYSKINPRLVRREIWLIRVTQNQKKIMAWYLTILLVLITFVFSNELKNLLKVLKRLSFR